MKKKKMRINWRTIGRNLYIIGTVIILGILIHKIAVDGISWISTIGYFD